MTSITYKLPDATTLIVGALYEFDNRNLDLAYVQDATGNPIVTMPVGSYLYCRCDDNSTAAGVWRYYWAFTDSASCGWISLGAKDTGTVVESVEWTNIPAAVTALKLVGRGLFTGANTALFGDGNIPGISIAKTTYPDATKFLGNFYNYSRNIDQAWGSSGEGHACAVFDSGAHVLTSVDGLYSANFNIDLVKFSGNWLMSGMSSCNNFGSGSGVTLSNGIIIPDDVSITKLKVMIAANYPINYLNQGIMELFYLGIKK